MKYLGTLIIVFCALNSYAQTTLSVKQSVINEETVTSFESPKNVVDEVPNVNKPFIDQINQAELDGTIPSGTTSNILLTYPTQSSSELTELNAIISANPQLRVISRSQVVIDRDGPTPILLPTEPIAPIRDPELAPEQQ
ncbi:MAG: hypothetical protein NXI20_18280 [bacterium]|nr:hypothetical protein [bacterium]